MLSSDFIGFVFWVVASTSSSRRAFEQDDVFSWVVPSTVLRVFWISCFVRCGFSGGVVFSRVKSSIVVSPVYLLEAFKFSLFSWCLVFALVKTGDMYLDFLSFGSVLLDPRCLILTLSFVLSFILPRNMIFQLIQIQAYYSLSLYDI